MKQERLTLTVDECAKILGIGRQLAYDKCKPGPHGEPPVIPVIKIGRHLLVPVSALEKLLANPQPLNPNQQANS